jgi:choline dehydrogenase
VLASRLARNDKGLKVLLIDAGSDPRANKHYQVPAFHALATEDPELRWDYFVEHFSDPGLAHLDEKYVSGKGIFYPRASAIGGCTAHHAMITVYPDPSDWDDIADMTRDQSWRSDDMWRYFDRCRDTDGFGWLAIEAAGFDTVFQAAHDATVDKILLSAV